MKSENQSLRHRFKSLAVRWSFAGALVSVLLILPILGYAIKHSSERQVEVMAKSLTRAFRPMLLEGYVRDTIPQIEDVAKLKDHESVSIVDGFYKSILRDGITDPGPKHCSRPEVACWLNGFQTVSITIPIYFDEVKRSELYGYLILNMNPTVDWTEVLLMAMLGALMFAFQLRGLYSNLKKEVAHISEVLNAWKFRVDDPKHIKDSKDKMLLFAEFLPLNSSIEGLHNKVIELENVAAIKAKTDIVRGIGHDLKTPLSQLAKFVAIFIHNTEKNNFVNPKEVSRINDVLKRMGDLIRQVTQFDKKTNLSAVTNLDVWVDAYVHDLKNLQDQASLKVSFELERNYQQSPIIQTDETDLFRLIDNIVRNSLEAFPAEKTGKEEIRISIQELTNEFELKISDNGFGIPENIKDKIFDLDFTTKKTRGTGLGLGIVKKICTDLGLNLNFYSELGQGTTFKIAFPKGVPSE